MALSGVWFGRLTRAVHPPAEPDPPKKGDKGLPSRSQGIRPLPPAFTPGALPPTDPRGAVPAPEASYSTPRRGGEEEERGVGYYKFLTLIERI